MRQARGEAQDARPEELLALGDVAVSVETCTLPGFIINTQSAQHAFVISFKRKTKHLMLVRWSLNWVA